MITAAEFSAAALSFPSAIDKPHFKRIAYKVDVKGGKTFATLAEDKSSANLILTPDQQDMMCAAEPKMFAPVANKWGEQGWTTFTFTSADKVTLLSALRHAWLNAAPAKYHAELEAK